MCYSGLYAQKCSWMWVMHSPFSLSSHLQKSWYYTDPSLMQPTGPFPNTKMGTPTCGTRASGQSIHSSRLRIAARRAPHPRLSGPSCEPRGQCGT
jgi:hypothetical protein